MEETKLHISVGIAAEAKGIIQVLGQDECSQATCARGGAHRVPGRRVPHVLLEIFYVEHGLAFGDERIKELALV